MNIFYRFKVTCLQANLVKGYKFEKGIHQCHSRKLAFLPKEIHLHVIYSFRLILLWVTSQLIVQASAQLGERFLFADPARHTQSLFSWNCPIITMSNQSAQTATRFKKWLARQYKICASILSNV